MTIKVNLMSCFNIKIQYLTQLLKLKLRRTYWDHFSKLIITLASHPWNFHGPSFLELDNFMSNGMTQSKGLLEIGLAFIYVLGC